MTYNIWMADFQQNSYFSIHSFLQISLKTQKLLVHFYQALVSKQNIH